RKEGAKRTRWRFLSDLYSKILPVPCGTFNPYIESESKLTLFKYKKVIIPMVYKHFRSYQIR
ncbi:hypothetical protein ACS2JF_28270, partial [Bacillus cereus group sp. BceL094]|uniref:hypothetical protein n=1 Tax=Bacillus cereus group sp. BceL094 TaxID=3445134 RepID=UPI003F281B89